MPETYVCPGVNDGMSPDTTVRKTTQNQIRHPCFFPSSSFLKRTAARLASGALDGNVERRVVEAVHGEARPACIVQVEAAQRHVDRRGHVHVGATSVLHHQVLKHDKLQLAAAHRERHGR